MSKMLELAKQMKYYCKEISLGYDQSNRWDIRDGGTCDCSSLVIQACKDCSLPTGRASYTGNMKSEFVKNGWNCEHYVKSELKKGSILLNEANHTAVYLGNGLIAEAAIDENGNVAGGKQGDQTGQETRVRELYDYPWEYMLFYDENANGKSIIIWDYHGSENQKWKLIDGGCGFFELESVAYPDFVLDVESEHYEEGTDLILWRRHYGNNQKFSIYMERYKGSQLHPYNHAELSLAVADGKDVGRGHAVKLAKKDDNCGQRWYLVLNDDNTYCILLSTGANIYALDVCGG